MTYLIRRFAAAYIDSIIVVAFILTFQILYTLANGESLNEVESPSANYWLLLQFITLFLYNFFFEFFFKRTIGKMLLRFRILGFDESLSLNRLFQILKRTLSRFIPLEPFSILLDEEREMWHDKLSKTKVVDARKL